ncbi:lactate dehydrogenase [Geothrix limicola]|uniref:Lactate dehydrogenase n=1 Tax=Geothrix limicola TaxID=2927978 RepID=A0ABQ5QC94_9BACT|nr:FAD-binding oxidoreductase [Geothrix limicola]GLH71981.1 lactate dehydrogenase [Geothrix limicola]
MSGALVQVLRSLLGDDAVLTDPEDLVRYEEGWRYGKGRALLVARPGTTAQVAATLAACHGAGVRVVPQGANTGLVGASTPDAGGGMVVLSLERLNRRLEVDPINRTAKVDGGLLLSALNEALKAHGLMFPIDLGADPSIGGMIATNTGGTRLLKYGDVRHNLLGVEVVQADGTVLDAMNQLRKNNTGLDLKQLFVGTSGVLGVITGAVLQVVPVPVQQATALVGCASGEAALLLLRSLERDLADVFTAFEVISAQALKPVFAHHEGLRNPYGAAEPPAYTALVELASTLPAAALDLPGLLEERLGAFLETEAGEAITDVFMGRAEDLWAIRHHVSESLRQEGKVLAFDISVPRSRMAAFTEAARALLASDYPFVRCCDFGHWGDGGTHLNLVWTEAGAPRPASELVPELQQRIYDLAVKDFDGSYSAEHGVGPHNQRFYEAYTPLSVRSVSGALKRHLDPEGILGTTRLD